jgi:hypothetical protein
LYAAADSEDADDLRRAIGAAWHLDRIAVVERGLREPGHEMT